MNQALLAERPMQDPNLALATQGAAPEQAIPQEVVDRRFNEIMIADFGGATALAPEGVAPEGRWNQLIRDDAVRKAAGRLGADALNTAIAAFDLVPVAGDIVSSGAVLSSKAASRLKFVGKLAPFLAHHQLLPDVGLGESAAAEALDLSLGQVIPFSSHGILTAHQIYRDLPTFKAGFQSAKRIIFDKGNEQFQTAAADRRAAAPLN